MYFLFMYIIVYGAVRQEAAAKGCTWHFTEHCAVQSMWLRCGTEGSCLPAAVRSEGVISVTA